MPRQVSTRRRRSLTPRREKEDTRINRRDEDLIPLDSGEYKDEFIDLIGRMRTGYWPCIDVKPGWYGIVAELNHELRTLSPNYVVLKVKEQMGELLYVIRVDEGSSVPLQKVLALVTSAQAKALHTCSLCGQPGDTVYTKSRMLVACEKCVPDAKKKIRRRRTKDTDEDTD